jgi:VIT1/CCC1 family predicted Fe2+/Mn2+ transporter
VKFERKLGLRRNCLIVFIILGTVSIAIGIIKICSVNDSEHITYYFSTGLAMVIAGSIKLTKTIAALTNKEKFENMQIDEYDEWNTLIRYKAAYYSFAATIIVSYTASLVFLFINSSLFTPFLLANSILVVFYLFFTLILRKTK